MESFAALFVKVEEPEEKKAQTEKAEDETESKIAEKKETTVESDAQLSRVIADKNAVIGDNMILKGTEKKAFFVKKNQIV